MPLAPPQGRIAQPGHFAPQGAAKMPWPPQGDPGNWSPLSLGSSLAAWYKADAGCYTDAACLFALASSQYLSKTSPTFAPTTKMTIRLSYKPTTIAAVQGLVGRWTNPWQFILHATATGELKFSLRSGAAATITGTTDAVVLTAGVSAEIVVVYDGTLSAANRVTIYVDGVAKAITIVGTWPTTLDATTVPLTVGTETAAINFTNGTICRLGFSSLALSGAALTAAHTSTFWADMTAARQADWFSFYNLCEASSTRVDSTGLNNLTPTNGPTVAAGPGEGLAVNNSPVKRWEDQSGNARHLVQATIANQPLYLTGIQNGRPVVRCDGVGDFLRTAGFTFNQPEDLFFAGRYVNAPSASDTMLDGASAQNTLRVYGPSATVVGTYAGGFGPTLTPSGITAFHAYRFLFNGASSIASVDAGADVTTGDVGAANAGGITIGANQTGGEPGSFELGELVAASASVAAPSSPKAYLKSRWATP